MNYHDYIKIIESTPETQRLKYQFACGCLNPSYLPLKVSSLNGCTDKVIKLPSKMINPYGNTVNVISFSEHTFKGNTTVTDIILSPHIKEILTGSFFGCESLERIYIPESIKAIEQVAFSGCKSLKDLYFEGSKEKWEELNSHTERLVEEFVDLIPGMPVQKVCNDKVIHKYECEELCDVSIHFNCKYPE